MFRLSRFLQSSQWNIRLKLTGIHKKYMSLSTAKQSQMITEEAPKVVSYWLFGMCGLVAGMVTIGGITRLTRSGLSMTDWKLQGSLPPMNHQHWLREFERYKTFPEWQQRKNMTLEEFKFIYFWEYGHRMFGRVIGVCFIVPGSYFLYKKMIPRSMYPRIGLLFSLGLSQGLIGWWMVKSGLEKDPEQLKEIRVSPYRLATHLSMAFTTYTLLLWTGLDLLKKTPLKLESSLKYIEKVSSIKRWAVLNAVFTASTILSGAFVAGNDAGRAYNSFPMMNDEWIPSEIFNLNPLWKNFFENTATVQFDHRILALSTLSSISLMYGSLWSSTVNQVRFIHLLPRSTQIMAHHVFGMAWLQVGLGISTLLLYVPVSLAAVHQIGSLMLLSFITVFVHSLKQATITGNKFNSTGLLALQLFRLVKKSEVNIFIKK